jgi:glycerate kinase
MTLPALVAPDSFKGTFAAADVAGAIARGLRAGGQEADELPVADGGEGTMDALVASRGGSMHTESVHDPLGRVVEASWALLDDGTTAVVEVAQASGFGNLGDDELDPWKASSYGTGELIAAAIAGGAKTVVIGVGGSATMEGGRGAIDALRDAGIGRRDASLVLACDVRTPFVEAARIFGPQKGADDAMVKKLTRRLRDYAGKLSRDPRGVPMTGAAGAIAGGLWAEYGASLEPGAPYVLDALRFDDAMRGARYVVTGEGKIDSQTLAGKVVGEVATRCRQGGVACYAVVGKEELDLFGQRVIDLSEVREAGTLEAMEQVGRELAEATRAAV